MVKSKTRSRSFCGRKVPNKEQSIRRQIITCSNALATNERLLEDRHNRMPPARGVCDGRFVSFVYTSTILSSGMSAFIPIKDDAVANEKAMAAVREDKEIEATNGHDGSFFHRRERLKVTFRHVGCSSRPCWSRHGRVHASSRLAHEPVAP